MLQLGLYLLGILLPLAMGAALGWYCAVRGRQRPVVDDEGVVRRALGFLRQLATGVSQDLEDHTRKMTAILEQVANPHMIAASAEQTLVLETIAELSEANDAMRARLNNFEKELEDHAEDLDRRIAETRLDPLTELANRRGFDEELTRRFAEWRRTGTNFSILLLDIDDFARFNSTYGRQASDTVLRQVAEVLRATVREMDMVARTSGSGLSVLLPATDVENAARVGGRMRQLVETLECKFHGHPLRVTASVGVAEASRGDNVRSLAQRADAALYAAKQAGGNSAYYHDGVTNRLAGAPMPLVDLANDDTDLQERRKSQAGTARSGAEAGDGARIDVLTGLLNRRVFADELWRRIDAARHRSQPLSLLLIGVDHLDTLNAFQGQPAVDRAMRKVAQVLSAVVRDADLVTRYGWEDFAVILSGTDLEEATAANARVRAALAACTLKLDHATEITVSTGIAELADDDDPLTLAKRADAALHHSKAAGGNSTHVCPGSGAAIVTLDASKIDAPTATTAK